MVNSMFWTVYYKGFYIHGRSDINTCYVNTDMYPQYQYKTVGQYKSLAGAKRAITKLISEMQSC